MYNANQQLSKNKSIKLFLLASAPVLTVPYTAIELHAKAHAHNAVSQRVETHHAGHNGRTQVFQHYVIGVLVP